MTCPHCHHRPCQCPDHDRLNNYYIEEIRRLRRDKAEWWHYRNGIRQQIPQPHDPVWYHRYERYSEKLSVKSLSQGRRP